MSTSVSIIIVNFRTRALVLDCIKSIIAYTSGIFYEIIIVDNGTGEFTNEDLSGFLPQIKLLNLPENIGFAAGNNKGIEIACGEYILLLNADTYLLENSIFKLCQFAKKISNLGAVSPRLIFPDGKIQSVANRFPSVRLSLLMLLRFQKLISKKRAGHILLGSLFDSADTVKVDWIWGACFLFQRSVIYELPGQKLDETYFMYFEDQQWCLDFSRLGLSNYFFADTEVVHLMGGSCAPKNDYMQKNGELFFRRNYSLFKRMTLKILDKFI